MRGHLIGQAVWQDPQAQAASQGTAAVIKAGVPDSTACVIGAVEGYRLVFSSARKP